MWETVLPSSTGATFFNGSPPHVCDIGSSVLTRETKCLCDSAKISMGSLYMFVDYFWSYPRVKIQQCYMCTCFLVSTCTLVAIVRNCKHVQKIMVLCVLIYINMYVHEYVCNVIIIFSLSLLQFDKLRLIFVGMFTVS